jgi:ubiquinone/menaquinone biosynthesis C-methylase UbiE
MRGLKMKAEKKYWDECSRRYDGENPPLSREDIEGFVKVVEGYRRNLPLDAKVKILDAAGGTGRLAIPLAKMGYEVTLSDYSSGMLSVAREKLSREGLLDKVKVVEADIADLPFEDGTFDVVSDGYCFRPERYSGELVRVLKIDGLIFSGYVIRIVPSKSDIDFFKPLDFDGWSADYASGLIQKLCGKKIKLISISGANYDIGSLSSEDRDKLNEAAKAVKMDDEEAIERWINLSRKKSVSTVLSFVGEKIR